jgi:hypothetical protein
MPATYEPIATTTLGSAAATITFSSISSAYTDLRLVTVGTSAANGQFRMQFNGDTATNYSRTYLFGTGTSALSGRQTSLESIRGDTLQTSIPILQSFDIFSYAGSTYKTVLMDLCRDTNGSGQVSRMVGLWQSTSAITSIGLLLSTGNFEIGTTATLYGIKKA